MFFSYDYKQSHEADRRAVMQGTPARVFMERAGLALADTVEAAMNAVEADEALFVCGGGNNGAMVHNALDGIPVIVIGVPVRYIHSHYGITSYYDFEATVQLAVAVVKSMNEEIIRSF